MPRIDNVLLDHALATSNDEHCIKDDSQINLESRMSNLESMKALTVTKLFDDKKAHADSRLFF